MRTSGRRATGVLAAAACVGTLAAATPAQAGLLSGLLGGGTKTTTTPATPPATPAAPAATANPLGGILGLVTGQNGLGGAVQGLLCPTLSTVSTIVDNPLTGGLSPITTGLTTLACNAGILDYRFETRFRRADGTIVTRTQVAQLGVPTLLNVDDDAAADLVGTITIVGRNAVGLKVERASGERGTLPVQVEAIVGNPGGTILGGRRISVGYDARDDRAPNTFTISTPADKLLASSSEVEASLTQTGRGERIAVLAGTFSGTGAQRVDATQARLDYRQSPDTAAFTVGLSGDTRVRATTNRPGGLLIADIATPDLDARAELRTLPATLDLGLQRDGSRVSYDGGGTSIGRLIADVRSKRPLLGDADRLRVDLDGMPVKGAIALKAPETTQGAFGLTAEGEVQRIQVQARGGEGEMPVVPGAETDAGATLDTTEGRFRLAARIFRLRSVSVAPNPAAFELRTGATQTFRIAAAVPGRGAGAAPLRLNATIRDLPTFLKVGLADGEQTRLNYAADAPVEELSVEAQGIELVNGADRLRLALLGLDGDGALALRSPEGDDGRLGLTAEGLTIEKLEVGATGGDRDYPTVPGGEDAAGARVDATDGALRLAARIYRPESIAVGTKPVSLSLKTGVVRPFHLDATIPGEGEGADPIHVEGLIRDLPKSLTLGLEEDAEGTRLRYAADSPVEELRVEAEGLPFVDGADRLRLSLQGLSGDGALALRAPSGDDGRLGLAAEGVTIEKLELGATGGDREYPEVPGGEDAAGAFVDATDGAFRLAARVFSLESIAVGTKPVSLTLKTGVVKPFVVDATVPGDEGEAPVHVEATIRDLPKSLTLGLEDGAEGTRLRYAADAPVESIDVLGSGIPLVDGADKLRVRLAGVSGDGAIGVGSGDDGAIGLSADGVSVDTVEVAASDAASEFPAVPGPEDGNGAFLDTTNGAFRLAARVFALRSITVDPNPVTLEATTGAEKPFRVDATLAPADDAPAGTAPTHVEALIENLPETFRLGLQDTPDGGSKLAYQASARVSRLEISATGVPILEGTDRIAAAVRDVPRSFELSLPEQAEGAGGPLATLAIGQGEPAIGELRLAAGALDLPVTGLNEDGTNNGGIDDLFEYRSADPAAIGVGVRLSGLRSLNLGLDPIAIELGQDASRSKPIDLRASLPNDEGPTSQITGRFSKTTETTSIRATLEDGQPTKLTFNNAANLGRLALKAANLGSIPELDLTLDDLPRTLEVCVDSAGGCRRANPNALSGGNGGGLNRPYAAQTSLNLDDKGTQLAGRSTTLNASLPVDGNQVRVENLRFRNLGFDLGQSGTFSYLGQDLPRIYLFIDSRSQPFTINRIQYPGTVESFRIGTDGQPATANNRIVWLKGTKGSFIKTLDSVTGGSLNCGGQRELSVKVLGLNVNILNILGQQVLPVCS